MHLTPLRRLRVRPLRAGARRARRLAGVPVRRRRRAVQLPVREAVASAEPAAGGRPAEARRPAPGADQGAQPAGAAAPARDSGPRTPRPGRRGARPTGTEFDAVPALADGLPAARVPRRRRAAEGGAGEPAARTATTRSTRSGRATTWSRRERPGSPSCPAGSPRSARGTCSADDGFGAEIWAASDRGDITPRAGTAGRPVAAHRRRRHDGPRPLRRPLRVRHPPGAVAAAARAAVAGAGGLRRGGALGVAGADVLPDGDDRRPRGRRTSFRTAARS